MTIGEILQKALLNTALGMGTVFAMLIFISLVIYCFNFISKTKKQNIQETAGAAAGKGIQNNTEEDDLIPVIIAAVLASKGIAADSLSPDEPAPYIVRSIRRIS